MGYLLVTTSTAHGYSDGDKVVIRGCLGMTEVNRNYYYVADATTYTFALKDADGDYIDGSDYGTYLTWGTLGTVRKTYTTITGLDHLEGETVHILADGLVEDPQVVAAGSITIDETSGEIHVGLPYTSTLKTMRVEAGSQLGTAQSKAKRISKVVLRMRDSLNCNMGTEDSQDEVDFDTRPLYSGDKEILMPSKYSDEGYVMVTQTDPLPLNILALIPYLVVNEG